MLAAALSPLVFGALVLGCRRVGARRLRPLLRLRHAHNVALCLYSAVAATSSLLKLEGSGRLDLAANGAWPLLCRSSPGTPPFWLASKYWEWLDTVFIIASGKTPSSLHLGHHATAASVTAVNMAGRPTPIFDIGTAINAAIHAFMYSYYANPELMRPFRQWITRAQLAQHALVLCCCLAALSTPWCEAPALPYGIALAAYAFYFCAFAHFYAVTYWPKRRD